MAPFDISLHECDSSELNVKDCVFVWSDKIDTFFRVCFKLSRSKQIITHWDLQQYFLLVDRWMLMYLFEWTELLFDFIHHYLHVNSTTRRKKTINKYLSWISNSMECKLTKKKPTKSNCNQTMLIHNIFSLFLFNCRFQRNQRK